MLHSSASSSPCYLFDIRLKCGKWKDGVCVGVREVLGVCVGVAVVLLAGGSTLQILAQTGPSARSSWSTDVWKLARSGEAAKWVGVCVSLKLARSGDAAKCSLEQFPKICKFRGLGFRV